VNHRWPEARGPKQAGTRAQRTKVARGSSGGSPAPPTAPARPKEGRRPGEAWGNDWEEGVRLAKGALSQGLYGRESSGKGGDCRGDETERG
jgi:hypothetical protein